MVGPTSHRREEACTARRRDLPDRTTHQVSWLIHYLSADGNHNLVFSKLRTLHGDDFWRLCRRLPWSRQRWKWLEHGSVRCEFRCNFYCIRFNTDDLSLLQPIKTEDGDFLGRGEGNHVSVEFNLLYRVRPRHVRDTLVIGI